jgi:hypothetical protein
MKRWLLKQWHRFTLGRTVTSFPQGYRDSRPGQRAECWYELRSRGARAAVPVGLLEVEVNRRKSDVPRGVVRIVLETCE